MTAFFAGPAPDGTIHIGLFAGSWYGDSGYARGLVDPWTGRLLALVL